jgi:methyltransferase, putative
MTRDELFARPLGKVSDFVFDEKVVKAFPDMIKRSVPGYETIIAMTGALADKYIQQGTNCYDLGCSLGASTLAICRHCSDRDFNMIGVDTSAPMIVQCQSMLDSLSVNNNIRLICDDANNIDIENASMVVLNFTLQFIPREQRNALIKKIYDGLVPGGILVLSEKVQFSDRHLDELMIDLYYGFKAANGYSELEISQKRTALENVLLPETLDTHKNRLKSCGFSWVDVWFQCFNFASMIAIKSDDN